MYFILESLLRIIINHIGIGLSAGPKRLTSLLLKFRSSSSVFSSSEFMYVGILLMTTFRERPSGSLDETKLI